ncbi:hypothetical protein MRB53_033387 [Persea americana]|uniref:Uncharacterized protein n=1 Tax=Persea americana TaxID=3435 RepID=A0ACC2KVK5_PERAE|nr:hypothetical protein MRB53_033387 [Persea americana]
MYQQRKCNFQFSSSQSGGKLENRLYCRWERRKAAISSFPPLGEEENWKIRFTADESGGKAVISSFPPLGAEENWKIDFTADGSGGNAAVSSFPPLRAAVMLRECPNIVARPFHFKLT